MEFVAFFFISWLVISLFGVMKKETNLIENTFIFLLILVININFSWIINDEWGLISNTKKAFPYIAFLLNRSIIIPLLILIQLNVLLMAKKLVKRIIILISTVILLDGLSLLSIRLNVIEFKEWNLWYESAYFFSLCLLSILCFKFFTKVSKREVKTHDAMGKL
ncbi:hypothetical protein [Bacillus sp. AK128]